MWYVGEGPAAQPAGKVHLAAGRPKPDMPERLRSDISEPLYASPASARHLAKAYRVIVPEQRFTKGRDPVSKPLRNVHREVDGGTSTGVRTPLPGF